MAVCLLLGSEVVSSCEERGTGWPNVRLQHLANNRKKSTKRFLQVCARRWTLAMAQSHISPHRTPPAPAERQSTDKLETGTFCCNRPSSNGSSDSSKVEDLWQLHCMQSCKKKQVDRGATFLETCQQATGPNVEGRLGFTTSIRSLSTIWWTKAGQTRTC